MEAPAQIALEQQPALKQTDGQSQLLGKKLSPGETCFSALPQWLLVLQTFLLADLRAYVWDSGLKALQSVSKDFLPAIC